MFKAFVAGRDYERGLGWKAAPSEAKRITELRAVHDDARKVWDEAREAEGMARREHTAVSLRVHRVARMRKLAAEHAETPPLNTPPTLAERMETLTGRLS